MLKIESALRKASGSVPFYSKYDVLKNDLFNKEYTHWCSRFNFGNNHGSQHIERVLEKLDALLGPSPLGTLNPYELFLTMVAILYHDIGVVRGRDHHNLVSEQLLIAEKTGRLLNEDDKQLIAVAVACHSSSEDIEARCGGFAKEHQVAKYLVRIRVVAALVRLADEIDEDKRRADEQLQDVLQVPEASRFYWEFCQRISGIIPDARTKSINVAVAFRPEDLARPVEDQAGSFIGHFGRKLQKINRERSKMNTFLPEPLQYGQIAVTVRWPGTVSRRTFVFNDTTTDGDFQKVFPEIVEEPCQELLAKAIDDMRAARYDEAEQALDRLRRLGSDVPLDLQLLVLYDSACLDSLRGARLPSQSEAMLDRGVGWLLQWLELNLAHNWGGANPEITIEKMYNDGDLSAVLKRGADSVRRTLPQAFHKNLKTWRAGGGGGCVAQGMNVSTPRGPVRIEDVRPGAEVHSLDPLTGDRLITRVAETIGPRSAECLCINGELIVTATQPLLLSDGRYIPAAQVKAGAQLQGASGPRPVTGVSPVGARWVFDLMTVHVTHNYLVAGYVCHNKMRIKDPG